MDIRNIYCIGRNYAAHAAELGNAVPSRPIVFSKPTHALAVADGKTVELPAGLGEIHHEAEIVLYIGKDAPFDNVSHVDEMVSMMALGVDFTLRDVQSELKEKGHPWLLAKGFKNSALVTAFWDFPGAAACEGTDFALKCDGNVVQQGNAKAMIFPFHTLLAYLHEHFGLGKGDIIFTGTPPGVGPVADGERYELCFGHEVKGSFTVQLW